MFKIKIYADGADYKSIVDLSRKKYISGFTTNPSLMRKSGIKDYKKFAKKILSKVKEKPISFEVFSDDLDDMKKEALEINSWAKNIYVKIPSCNTKGKSTKTLIKDLSNLGIKLNVTAVFTYSQAQEILKSLNKKVPSIISIFCGRIADTGRDPLKLMSRLKNNSSKYKNVEILWASTREIYNIIQAEKSGFNIITVPNNILSKFHMLNLNLNNLTLDTVKTFHEDASKSKFKII